jgi:glutaredoxin
MAIVLTLLGKPDCHLCHEMRDLLERVLPSFSLTFVEKDVRDDPGLESRYVFEIPVLLAGERELARHRIGETELRVLLAELAF